MSARARRLVAALASLFEGPKPARAADVRFGSDAAPLLRHREDGCRVRVRRTPVTSSDCPLQGCATCPPSALDREINRAGWWLITAYPDVWYRADPTRVLEVAGRLVALRARVDAGLVAP